VGHCGSAHDATVFRSAHTYLSSCDLFEPGEWIWADSAYALDAWCVTPYNKPLSTHPENKKFNYHLSWVRVKSEHAMGYIKGWFSSLCGLRQQIDDAVDHECAIAWIKACIVIHTLIFQIEHGQEDPLFIQELVQAGSDASSNNIEYELAAEVVCETRGQRMREKLKKDLFDYLEDDKLM
jgi:hypothetical protein